jgi:hypothetical protein
MSDMSDTSPDKTPLLGVDWLKAVAGALAAVSTTVLLSTLGAAGTLIGAAVGSIAATVATAVYSQGLDRSRARVRQLAVRPGAFPVDPAAPVPPVEPTPASDDPAVRRAGGWLERLRSLRWGRLLPAALVMFLVVIAAVTVFELASGRTLASTVRGDDSGGTTISHVTGNSSGSKHRTPTPSDDASPTSEPSGSTGSPSASATPSESTSPTAEPSESAAPTESATPTPTETTSPTADGSASASPAEDAPPAE